MGQKILIKLRKKEERKQIGGLMVRKQNSHSGRLVKKRRDRDPHRDQGGVTILKAPDSQRRISSKTGSIKACFSQVLLTPLEGEGRKKRRSRGEIIKKNVGGGRGGFSWQFPKLGGRRRW